MYRPVLSRKAICYALSKIFEDITNIYGPLPTDIKKDIEFLINEFNKQI